MLPFLYFIFWTWSFVFFSVLYSHIPSDIANYRPILNDFRELWSLQKIDSIWVFWDSFYFKANINGNMILLWIPTVINHS